MVPESIPSCSSGLENSNIEETCQRYSSGILNGSESILSLVETLGKQMVSTVEDERCYATTILSGVVERLPSIQSQEALQLAKYFTSRLDDRSSFIPVALEGLTALVRKGGGEDCARLALSGIEEHIQTQAMTQADRRRVYLLYTAIVDHALSYAVQIGDEFIRRLCTSMDGESDPRNLVLLFSLLPRTLPLFTLTPSTADILFAVLECYFPVDFTPSSKYAITREELRDGLETSLVSSAQLLAYCVPLAIEKIQSGLKVALLDALSLVRRVVSVWGSPSLGGECSRLGDLWDALRIPLLETGDREVVNACILTVSACMSVAAQGGQILPAVDRIIQYVKVLIRDPAEDPAFSRTCQLYGAAALANEHLAAVILPHAVSVISALFKTERVYKEKVLTGLEPLLVAAAAHPPPNDEVVRMIEALVNSMAQDGKIVPPGFIDARWKCLLASVPIIPSSSRSALLSYFSRNVPERSSWEMDVLTNMASSYPEEVKEEVLDKLKPDGDLAVAICCCKVSSLTDSSCKVILSALLDSGRVVDAVTNLRKLTDSCPENVILKMERSSQFITCLLSVSESIPSDKCLDLAICIRNIFRLLPTSDQDALLKECCPKYFSNLFSESPCLAYQKIVIAEGFVGAVRGELITENKLELLASKLMSQLCLEDASRDMSSYLVNPKFNAIHCTIDFVGRLIASVINKLSQEEEVSKLLEIVSHKPRSVGEVRLLSWITKALVLRAHPNYRSHLERLVILLKDNTLAFEAAHGFKLLLSDEPHFLNESCHCTVRLLYKQRVFSFMDMVCKVLEEPNPSGAGYLVLAHMVHYCPPQLINSNLKQLMRHVSICLDTSDPTVLGPVLETVSTMITNSSQVFLQHIDTFIPACLRIVSCKQQIPMRVRLAAVDCLCQYSNLPDCTYLLPYKEKVVRSLAALLDDPKRIVRRQVVKARTSWYLVGSV